MAEFDNLTKQFESIHLDVNENPSSAENDFCARNNDVNKTVPLGPEIAAECILSESLQFPENVSQIETPENTNETIKTTLDALLRNVEEKNDECDMKFGDTHLPSSNNIQMPEIMNEIIQDNNLNTLLSSEKQDTSNRSSDSGIQDSKSNIAGDSNMIDFGENSIFSADSGGMVTEFSIEENDVQVKDEEFHDAVQFFKDPSSFTFLENAGSTNPPTDSLITRSSLYVNFDPLHAKFFSQPVKSNELHEIAEGDAEPEVQPNAAETPVPNAVNKHLANVSPRESLGNVLISFDSPTIKDTAVLPPDEDTKVLEPPKLYSEEELQQALKLQELKFQETCLKKQQDMETKLQEQNIICEAYRLILKEIMEIVNNMPKKEKALQEKVEESEKEINKLKEDLKTSSEDMLGVERAFSDLHKRYEQSKNMLKVYTQNESNLKEQLENMKVQLQEKEEMYKTLQSRTEETINKANIEVANVKKAGDAQAAVLKAQLKKAELKISSLESDVKHVRIENGKLSSICDELMAKVSES